MGDECRVVQSQAAWVRIPAYVTPPSASVSSSESKDGSGTYLAGLF